MSCLQDVILEILQKLGMPKRQAEEKVKDTCKSPNLGCNGNGTIKVISLVREELCGKIPKELSKLQSLETQGA